MTTSPSRSRHWAGYQNVVPTRSAKSLEDLESTPRSAEVWPRRTLPGEPAAAPRRSRSVPRVAARAVLLFGRMQSPIRLSAPARVDGPWQNATSRVAGCHSRGSASGSGGTLAAHRTPVQGTVRASLPTGSRARVAPGPARTAVGWRPPRPSLPSASDTSEWTRGCRPAGHRNPRGRAAGEPMRLRCFTPQTMPAPLGRSRRCPRSPPCCAPTGHRVFSRESDPGMNRAGRRGQAGGPAPALDAKDPETT
jgi:hypothetical protein